MKTIDDLITQGESFNSQIKLRANKPDTITIIGGPKYYIQDVQAYSDWCSLALLYLREYCNNNDTVKDFEQACSKITPTNHIKMLSILKALKSISSSSNESEFDSELDAVERLSKAYENECNNSPISEYCISTFHKWYAEALVLFSGKVPDDNQYLINFRNINRDVTGYSLREQYNLNLPNYRMLINYIKHDKELEARGAKKKYGDKVFIVHGHNEAVKSEVARTLERIGLKAVILHEQPNKGKTIIEKLENNSSDVGFAVILLTADDKGKAKKDKLLKDRARQNVVFEMGLFMSLLGRNRVILLLENGVEKPGDLDGMVYTSIDGDGFWKYKLCDELKVLGYNVSKDNL